MISPLRRMNRIFHVEKVAPTVPVAPAARVRVDAGLSDYDMDGMTTRFVSDFRLTASWLQAASRLRPLIQDMRRRRLQLLSDGAAGIDLSGLADTVYELAERWNDLELLYFRCRPGLNPSIETDLRSMRSHPAARHAGLDMNKQGAWRVNPVALNQQLENRPDAVLRALFSSEGLLPYADQLLASFEAQPAASLIDHANLPSGGTYNEDGVLEDMTHRQVFSFSCLA